MATRITRLAACSLLIAAGTAIAQQDLAGYYGFEDPRIIVVDDNMGPALAADLDQDGLTDLLVVNDRKSRIEVYRQRRAPRTEAEMDRLDVNELSRSPYYDRIDISVGHAISGFRVHDVDGDGKLDILYAGIPSEIVYMRQTDDMTFEVEQKRRVRGLASGQDGFEVADVRGDGRPELCCVVEGRIHVYDLTSSGVTGEPLKLGSGGQLAAFFIEDYNADGRNDVCAVIPDDDAPVRMWFGSATGLGAEMRFEMPGLIEAEPIRFNDRRAASLSVIERASRRMVFYDVVTEAIEPIDLASAGTGAQRDATAEVIAFASEDDGRSIAGADINADGLEDLVVTDAQANAMVLYTQRPGVGFSSGEAFSAFKEPKAVGAGQWDGAGPLEVFVLSEEEKTVGVSTYDPATGRLAFPQPIAMSTPGAEPVAMAVVDGILDDRSALAVVVRDRRDHTLELHAMGEETEVVALEGVNRPPQSMLSGDFDADGFVDLLLFTPNEPLVMVTGADRSVLSDESMPQFGLVQAAGPTNTALLDVDGDGAQELLIADENFVRACAFDTEKGWRVVEQITLPDPSTQLTAITTANEDGRDVIIAADQANRRLVMMTEQGGAWGVAQTLGLTGIRPSRIDAGRFTGDDSMSVLAFAPDAFGIVRLSGQRVALEEFAAYRSDEEDRLEHEAEFGDINGDGYLDMIVLDAREQMCQVFAFSSSRKLYFATEFKVFESRLFSRGDSRSFEPSAAIIADVTGDGADDLILEVHDRYIIYPQMTTP
ncbi:MAG: hypothetical protein Tsb0013_11760 [Phycisphaerales bacterium]